MRIGMLSWESLYSIRVGGVAPHVSELSEALAKKGHEVHIFTRRETSILTTGLMIFITRG